MKAATEIVKIIYRNGVPRGLLCMKDSAGSLQYSLLISGIADMIYAVGRMGHHNYEYLSMIKVRHQNRSLAG